MSTPNEQVTRHCPKCGADNLVAELPMRGYRCGDCGLELAHLDTLPTGAIRGVVGWLRSIGEVVNGRYRISAVLGKGGFGVTYLVDDLRLQGKRRALKEVPEILFDDYETRLLGRLNHPAIPDITDRFVDAEMVYLVLEFGGDRTLRMEQERRGGRIPLFVLLPWMRELCDALLYLHRQDPPVVHRDLKPDNVLIDENDRVMLIDFGISKEAASGTVTRTIGRAVSHGFSPPEQVLGTGTDARSDIYALGAIMYSALTGRTPPAAHERVTGVQIEPLSHVLPEIPPLIESTILQALELNINLRQQSTTDIARVLDLVLAGTASAQTVMAGTVPDLVETVSRSSVRLPSVPLASQRSHTHPRDPTSLAVQPGATKAKGSPRWVIPVALLLLGAGAGVGLWNGWWGWLEPAPGPAGEASGQAEALVKSNTGPDVQSPGASHLTEETAKGPVSDPGLVRSLPDESPDLAPDLGSEVDAVSMSQALAPAGAGEGKTIDGTAAGLATSGIGEGATKVGPDTGEGALPSLAQPTAPAGIKGAGPTTASVTDAVGPRVELPSIFSDEQAASTTRPRESGGSLMELFEQLQGSRSGEDAGMGTTPSVIEPAPVAPASQVKAEPPAAPAVVPQRPKPQSQSKAAATKSPARAQTSKPKSSGSSAWGFQYKGATKND